MKDYSDIIDTQWPPQRFRETMPLSKRAKIFLPFSALNGYEQALEETLQSAIEESRQKTGSIKFDDILEE